MVGAIWLAVVARPLLARDRLCPDRDRLSADLAVLRVRHVLVLAQLAWRLEALPAHLAFVVLHRSPPYR